MKGVVKVDTNGAAVIDYLDRVVKTLLDLETMATNWLQTDYPEFGEAILKKLDLLHK